MRVVLSTSCLTSILALMHPFPPNSYSTTCASLSSIRFQSSWVILGIAILSYLIIFYFWKSSILSLNIEHLIATLHPSPTPIPSKKGLDDYLNVWVILFEVFCALWVRGVSWVQSIPVIICPLEDNPGNLATAFLLGRRKGWLQERGGGRIMFSFCEVKVTGNAK